MTKSINYRSRKHLLLLYPDTTQFNTVSKFVDENYDYLYILHDEDTDELNQPIKPHIHMIIFTHNAIWNTALSTILDIETRFIQKVRNDEQVMQYLLHYNQPTKYQYTIDQLIGTDSLKKRLENILKNDDLNESEKTIELLHYIESSEYISYTDFAKYCASNNKWDILRRSSYYFIKLIDEHNEIIREKHFKELTRDYKDIKNK